MTFKRIAPALPVILAAFPAFADISAMDAWDMVRSAGEDTGMTVAAADTNMSGGTLTVSNIRYTLTTPEISMAMHFDQMVFEETGDGRVIVTMSDAPLAMTIQSPEEDEVEILARLSTAGGETIMSGDPGAISSNFSYPALTFTLDDFIVEGEAMDASAVLRAANVEGTYAYVPAQGEELASYTAAYDVASVTMDVEFEIPEEADGGRVEFSGGIDGLSVAGGGSVMSMAMSPMPEGFVANSLLTRGASEFSMSFSGPDGDFDVQVGDQSGVLKADFSDGSMNYSSDAIGTNISVSGTALPLPPIEISMASSGGEILMPLQPSQESQDFAIGLRIEGLTVNDFIWSMLDPFNALPHDPANIRLAVSGTGKLTVDVFDPGFDPEMMAGAPGALESLNVDELFIQLVGAELSASGSTINMQENALAMPIMVGAFDIQGSGIQGLMQNLGQMGMLPPQQASMANMMLGMFTVPGATPDSFTSRIELTEEGGVLANGQQLR